MKSIQLQFGISVKDKAVDIIVDNEGIHLHYDNLGDVTKESLKCKVCSNDRLSASEIQVNPECNGYCSYICYLIDNDLGKY